MKPRARNRLIGALLAAVFYIFHSAASAHDPSTYGGLFRSRDGGATWLPADAGLFLNGPFALAIDPRDSHHLLLATDSGLLRSRNGGRDWLTEADELLFGGVYAAAFYADGQGALAASAAGVYFGDADGLWQKTAAPRGAAPAFAIAPGSVAGRMYVAGIDGLWRSDEYSQRWTDIGADFASGSVQGLWISSGPEEQVYALAAGRLWLSTDGGAHWQPRTGGLPEGRLQALAQQPPARLWAVASAQVFTSGDGGASWQALGQPLPKADTAVRGIAVEPGGTVILLTTERGLLRSVDQGRSWHMMEGNLPLHLEAGPLVRDPADPAILYAGFSRTPYGELWALARTLTPYGELWESASAGGSSTNTNMHLLMLAASAVALLAAVSGGALWWRSFSR